MRNTGNIVANGMSKLTYIWFNRFTTYKCVNTKFINKNLLIFTNKYDFVQNSRLYSQSNHLTKMKIGTHDGVFHCDEVLACYMLQLLPTYKNAEIVRTREMKKLDECDIVVDVGAVFDKEKLRFDHHQREFKETLSTLRPEFGDSNNIRLSSAGLIYVHYGEEIIRQMFKSAGNDKVDENSVKLVFKKVYKYFIEEIDAIDNGVPMTDEEPKYKIHTHLSARVARLNPEWNTSLSINIDDQFQKAMTLVSEEFLDKVRYFSTIWLPARDLIKESLNNRFGVHNSGQIVQFTERFPWKEHLFDLEVELGIPNIVKYVIFNDKPGSWRVQAVPVSPSSFICRKFLHKNWWGVRDEILNEVTKIPGCIFCHSTGFIGGNQTRDGALAMAVASLEAE